MVKPSPACAAQRHATREVSRTGTSADGRSCGSSSAMEPSSEGAASDAVPTVARLERPVDAALTLLPCGLMGRPSARTSESNMGAASVSSNYARSKTMGDAAELVPLSKQSQ